MNTTTVTAARVFALVDGEYISTTRAALGATVLEWAVTLDEVDGEWIVHDGATSEVHTTATNALRTYSDFLETFEDAAPAAFGAEIARALGDALSGRVPA